jgi:hypothetical protein
MNGLNLNRKDARRKRNERKEILTARTQGETAMNGLNLNRKDARKTLCYLCVFSVVLCG